MAEFNPVEGAVETTKKVNEGLLERLRELETERTVKVGVFGNAGAKQEKGMTILRIAQIHEFGTDRAGKNRNIIIPERSFLRSTGREKKKEIMEEQRRILGAYMKGSVTIYQALGILGESIVSKIKRKIRDGIEPANAPSTIARKGSSTPLVDTGQLINSIGYEVEKGGLP